MILLAADWKLDAALGSCLLLGLRHGFDYDHLAAISDITAVQRTLKDGLRLGLTYALGHAFMVAVLGVAVLELHVGLPEGLDHLTERLIGLTLIFLGAAVIAGIVRRKEHGHHARIESRLAAGINAARWAAWRVRRTWNSQAERPPRFQWIYSGKSVFLIGVLHGVGAETPSQLGLFFLAKSLGGTSRGLLGLGAFAVGLVVMNGIMTACMGGAFRASNGHARLYHWIAWTGAAYSCVIGLVFLFGVSDRLPQGGEQHSAVARLASRTSA